MKSSSRSFAPGTSLPMQWLYRFLRTVIGFSTSLYFRRITVIGAEHLEFSGPAILIGNHPNTLLDPYLAGKASWPYLYFLAKASLWKTLPGRLFFDLFCIPVARRKDVSVPGIDNDDSFVAASAHLRQGGVLYIAPEGTSELERRIRPVKSGTARIVLQTLRDADFKLPLKLVTIGLTYSDPTNFRGEVWLHAAPAMRPQISAEAYRENYRGLVDELTEKIQQQLEALTLVTRDDAEDAQLRQLELLLHHEQALDGPGTFYRSRDLLAGMHALSVTDYEQLRLDTAEYTDTLAQYHLSDRVYASEYRLFVLGLPLYLYGFVNNILPAGMIDALAYGITDTAVFRTTARWVGSLVLLPLIYAAQIAVVQAVFGRWWISLLYTISLIPSGLFAHHYHQRLAVLAERLRYRRLSAAVRARLDQLRAGILSRITPLISSTPPVR